MRTSAGGRAGLEPEVGGGAEGVLEGSVARMAVVGCPQTADDGRGWPRIPTPIAKYGHAHAEGYRVVSVRRGAGDLDHP